MGDDRHRQVSNHKDLPTVRWRALLTPQSHSSLHQARISQPSDLDLKVYFLITAIFWLSTSALISLSRFDEQPDL